MAQDTSRAGTRVNVALVECVSVCASVSCKILLYIPVLLPKDCGVIQEIAQTVFPYRPYLGAHVNNNWKVVRKVMLCYAVHCDHDSG